ncbi:MAG: glycoside hydrolase family 15 protein [Methanosarcinaceae archaeon]|nr:glycoside hydrolase family 15 protein [Methanosarcinaceae archaeon]
MRPLIFGNGRFLLCEDERGVIRDIYYPHVGIENHGNSIRAGLCDLDYQRCTWFDTWEIQQKYKSDFTEAFRKGMFFDEMSGESDASRKRMSSNIGETIFENPELKVRVTIWDTAHPSRDFFNRVFEVKNISDNPRRFRLFSNQNYKILGNKIGETAVVDGDFLIHYKDDRYFLHSSRPSFEQFAVGTADWKGLEGTWRDMEEDGALSGNVVAHGSVDSTIGWTLPLLWSGDSARISYWLAFGKSYHTVKNAYKWLQKSSTTTIYQNAFNFWNSWIRHTSVLPEYKQIGDLPENVRYIFYRSLLTIVSQMDITGSVIASCDSDIKQFGADLYTYCWPRDAAWAVIALDRAKYHGLSTDVLEFFSKIISKKGYFLHKYTPRGNLGSTWHPIPMIQLDETGLPLYAIYHHWQESKNIWPVARYFESLIVPAANYLVNSLDRLTILPSASFDLWEERKGVQTYTACTIYAGLHGASELAHLLGNDAEFKYWAEAAGMSKDVIPRYFYDKELKRFKRSVDDSTIDASVFAVWYFGVLPPDDSRVSRTMKSIEKELTRPSGGVSRYTNDSYYGYMNSWIICTLWLAQWHIAVGNLTRAMELIEWCADHAHPTGLMPEQVDDDGKIRSVLPLVWSHSTYVLAVLEYLKAVAKQVDSESQ